MHPGFHPSVSEWFSGAFGNPTEVQEQAWTHIVQRKHTLIAAPTGSGKTLAGFLAVIDDLVKQGMNGSLQPGVQIVYISPLKALSNDIERNLQFPLRGVREKLAEMGLPEITIEAMVRTGDTPQAERGEMLKNPPHILVTTPESLYLLLTSTRGRQMLSTARTLIIDEIHALIGGKRGSHLALSVQRLQALTGNDLLRIGISATQKPIEQVAHFLTGSEKIPCHIVNTGHKRHMELAIELPKSPLSAVMANEVWTEIYDRLEQLIGEHETTLIFVNTRRMAERIAFHLAERMGESVVMAHHGSMSREHRFEAEQKLKAGQLRALVATASLELGIDIGSVNLVCQLGSPRSIAAFLQRVGRSGHTVAGTPKGFLFPLTRDELVECVAMIDAVRKSELDRIIMPEKPVDILSQQIVAEIACRDCDENEIFELFTQSYPFRDLERKTYDEIIRMLSEGYTTRRGRRGAYIHYDAVNGKLKARKGARLAALLSGGAIPDLFDYDIILQPESIFVGTLNEDFAIESLPGDIFQLGNNTWKILKVETGRVLVEDAAGQPPSIPFWLGEAPGRTDELSFAVSRLREGIAEKLGKMEGLKPLSAYEEGELVDETWKKAAVDWVMEEAGVQHAAADQLVTYLATGKAAMGMLPSQNNLVLERFFDEAGDMHLIIHSTFGSRINKAWGLSLRKKFCRKFNFELQAAATEDAIILSLGATHSFPLDEVYHYLNPAAVRNVLVQALLDSPMFGTRWRWNATRALAVLRRYADRRVPPQIQRSQSEDLIALVFPDQLACLENIAGDREVPDHPLVHQTIHDCLTELMDIEGLEKLITRIKEGTISMHAMDLREASPLAAEILTARPYAFLDDAPLEERRTNAVQQRRWLDPAEAKGLGQLDIAAIEAVKQEAWPEAQNAEELHDALVLCGYITQEEGERNNWNLYFAQLMGERRATRFDTGNVLLWVAAERLFQVRAVHPAGVYDPLVETPGKILVKQEGKDPLAELIRGRLEALGPVTAASLAEESGLGEDVIMQGLIALENEGFVFRGHFVPGEENLEWCERRLLARIHRYTLQKLRSEIEPVSAADFMRYLFRRHQVDGNSPQGTEALKKALARLEGFEAQAAAWESDLLPSRVSDYDYLWLDVLCLSGNSSWGRFRPAANSKNEKPVSSPIKTTPVAIVSRANSSAWQNGATADPENERKLSPEAQQVLKCLQTNGACFFQDIGQKTGLFKSQLEDALSELVASCLVTSDSFNGLRALLVPAKYKQNGGARSRNLPFTMEQAGRWSLLQSGQTEEPSREKEQKRLESIARILLHRYGVLFRKLVEREAYAPAWRELVRTLRMLEARGEIRGGRFVTGVWGEQFALPDAVAELRGMRKEGKKGTLVSISAADPLNLTGIITPGRRISGIFSNRVLYLDGVPVAVKEGKEIQFLVEADDSEKWKLQNALIQRKVPPRLKAYLGKGVF
ncbi:MAG: ATP-dependent helicase Lhr and Lhr-like helicase [Bacteroidetes bacterium]|nr:MAG: ATP-dependent helicase Lhr and Lhr-like helicase [Bacteroidota bacterium]